MRSHSVSIRVEAKGVRRAIRGLVATGALVVVTGAIVHRPPVSATLTAQTLSTVATVTIARRAIGTTVARAATEPCVGLFGQLAAK